MSSNSVHRVRTSVWLEIHGTPIRLWGIDPPESSQLWRGEDSLQYRCGAKSANDLDAFIARRPVSCAHVIWIVTAQQSRLVWSAELILETGSSATALSWTGRDIRKAGRASPA